MTSVVSLPKYKTSYLTQGVQRINIIGPSESGKTTLCYHLLEEVFLGRGVPQSGSRTSTDVFIVYGANRGSLNEWEKFFKFHDLTEKCIFILQDKNDQVLANTLEAIGQASSEAKHPKTKPLRYTIILDDFVGSVTGVSLSKKKDLINFLLYQSRHIGLNVIFIFQDVCSIHSRAFSSATCNILFKDLSLVTLEDHYYKKILAPCTHQIHSGYVSKAKAIASFYEIIGNLRPFECLVTHRFVSSQKTKLYSFNVDPTAKHPTAND